jgi:predicted ATP-binding protein involved in virulence
MAKRIESIEGVRIHGHFYLHHRFSAGVNIVYGHNGGGKTTLLEILANAISGNFIKFAYLDFSEINIEFDDGKILSISKVQPTEHDDVPMISVRMDEELIISIPIEEPVSTYTSNKTDNILIDYGIPQVSYFPAYRILYDYLVLSRDEQNRKLLSPFSPLIYYPSINEIEENLQDDVIKRDSIQLFVNTVNRFYEKKKLVLRPKSDIPFEIIYEDQHRSRKLSSLFSGERQITTMFYAVSQLNTGSLVLIDEPEISLDVVWQRKILRTILSMFKTEQIIACTHSPIIAADFEDRELEFRFAGKII